MQTCVLLSIKPEFVEAILTGRKRYEYRRVTFRRPMVNRVVIYSSSPVQKVVGEFTLERVESHAPRKLWALTRADGGINRTYFDQYFEGKHVAHALRIGTVRVYTTPLDLKEDLGLRRPPQSFCYISSERLRAHATARSRSA